jgi:hypothetical protein
MSFEKIPQFTMDNINVSSNILNGFNTSSCADFARNTINKAVIDVNTAHIIALIAVCGFLYLLFKQKGYFDDTPKKPSMLPKSEVEEEHH